MKCLMNAVTVVALVGFLGIAGCAPEDTTDVGDTTTTTTTTDGVTTTDDTVKPGDVAEGDVATGQTVTARGEVERLIDERSFAIIGDWEFFSDDLVVVSQTDLPVIAEGDEVEVTGVVRNVGLVEIAKETNWKFNPQVRVELEDVTGYLVAESVRVVERD